MEYQHFWQEILTHKKQSSLACKLYYIRKIKNPLLLQIPFFSFLSVTVAWQENWGSCWKWSNQLAPGIRFLLSLLGNHWSAFTFSSGKLIVLYLFLLWGLCFQGLGFAALEGLTPRLNPENQVYEPKGQEGNSGGTAFTPVSLLGLGGLCVPWVVVGPALRRCRSPVLQSILHPVGQRHSWKGMLHLFPCSASQDSVCSSPRGWMFAQSILVKF